MQLLRNFILLSLVGWTVYCAICPVWRGAIYNFDPIDKRWISGGAFGISKTGSPFLTRAPVWNQPVSSGGLATSFRAPFRPITATHHVEVAMGSTLWRWSSGLLIAGAFTWLFQFFIADFRALRSLTVISWLAKCLLAANICLFVLAGLSMGYALTEFNVIAAILVALFIGSTVGCLIQLPNSDPQSIDGQSSI